MKAHSMSHFTASSSWILENISQEENQARIYMEHVQYKLTNAASYSNIAHTISL